MKEKKLWIICAVGGLLVAGGLAFWLLSSDSSAEGDAPDRAKKAHIAASRPKAPRPKRIASSKKKSAIADKAETEKPEKEDVELSAEDQKTMDLIQDALDADNLKDAETLAQQVVNHPVAEIRQRAVEALRWFGDKAVASLMPFLADSDEDVRTSALDAVETGFAQMENEHAKLRYIESLMRIRNVCSEDCLTMLTGQLTGMEDEVGVVQAAVRIIEGNENPDSVKAMKEVYEFATGDEYTTRDAAETWCKQKAEEALEDAAETAEAEAAEEE